MNVANNNVESDAAKNVSSLQGELFREETDWRQRLSETLRTRLNAIIGFSELLGLEQLSATGRSDLKQVLKAARDMLGVVDHELGNLPGNTGTTANGVAGVREKTCDLLYIEDDIANLTLVERILELRPGLVLKHATHGQMGLGLARTEKPKLILLDLNLPDIHGADVLSVLQSTPETAQIPVVVLSANASPTQIERLLAAGARNYLTKPFDLDRFLAVLDEWAAPSPASTVRAA